MKDHKQPIKTWILTWCHSIETTTVSFTSPMPFPIRFFIIAVILKMEFYRRNFIWMTEKIRMDRGWSKFDCILFQIKKFAWFFLTNLQREFNWELLSAILAKQKRLITYVIFQRSCSDDVPNRPHISVYVYLNK